MKKTNLIKSDSNPPIKINRSRDSGKKRVDLFARLRNDEHPLDHIFPESGEESLPVTKPVQPVQSNVNQSNVNQSNVSQSNSTPPKQTAKPIAPVKDYQKVPNSITRDAVPSGLFKGTSKNTYDALYLKTRGAITPTRTVKATKRELMKWAGVSDVTLFKHLKNLQAIGLIKIEFQMGAHDGSVYEVLIPEEIQFNQSNPIQSNPIQSNVTQSDVTQPSQSDVMESNKLGLDTSKKVGLDWMGKTVENKDSYESAKTSLKTNTNDDDALVGLRAKFDEVSRKLTNNGLNKNDEAKWSDLATLLIMELEIAAARTTSISNVPAFLTEHLRRRFSAQPSPSKKPANTPPAVKKPLKSASSVAVDYEAEPLTEKGRETVLKTMKDYINRGQREFVMNLELTYTEEDWKFLIDNLE